MNESKWITLLRVFVWFVIFCGIFAGMTYLAGMQNAGAQNEVASGDPRIRAAAEAVYCTFKAEYALYRNPTSVIALRDFARYATDEKYDYVYNRVQRALGRSDVAAPDTAVIFFEVVSCAMSSPGDEAIVRTREISWLTWHPSGHHWPTEDPDRALEHVYYLTKENGRWRVTKEIIEQ